MCHFGLPKHWEFKLLTTDSTSDRNISFINLWKCFIATVPHHILYCTPGPLDYSHSQEANGHAWCLILCAILSGLRDDQMAGKTWFLGVSVRAFLVEISVWIGAWNKVDGSPLQSVSGHHLICWGPGQDKRWGRGESVLSLSLSHHLSLDVSFLWPSDWDLCH